MANNQPQLRYGSLDKKNIKIKQLNESNIRLLRDLFKKERLKMAGQKRLICEEGVILSKEHIDATSEFTSSKGEKVAAQPEKYVLKVISSPLFKQNEGFVNPIILDYKVDSLVYASVKYGDKIKVYYEFTSYGCKAKDVELIKQEELTNLSNY